MDYMQNLLEQKNELLKERAKWTMCPPPTLIGKIRRINNQIEAGRIAERARARAMEVKRTQRFNHEA